MTPQEQRDQDYLEGYGYGIVGTKTEHQLSSHTVAFIRGYRDAVKDREVNDEIVEAFLDGKPLRCGNAGGEPA